MIFLVVSTILSEYQPYYIPQCVSNNKCPDTIDPTLTSLNEEQYCGCRYKNSKVKIDESIRSIPKYAFYGSHIKKIILHNKLQIIEEGAFGNCEININISAATELRNIGDGAFYKSQTSSTIIFPKSLIIIGSYAFANVTSLKHASIHHN